jgi:hypothetical protein
MDTTRGGEAVSAQIGVIGAIENLHTQNFRKDDVPFNVKNDGTTSVLLEVNLWGMPEGVFVPTQFAPGWNPEIVREIKMKDAPDLDLKYGY